MFSIIIKQIALSIFANSRITVIYHGNKRLCDISAKDVIDWQNEIRKQTNSSGEPLSQGYLKTIER